MFLLSANIYVSIFGHKLTIQLKRPFEEDHHNEFGEYFCFGGHNSGFTTNRIIASFPTSFDANIDIAAMKSTIHMQQTRYCFWYLAGMSNIGRRFMNLFRGSNLKILILVLEI